MSQDAKTRENKKAKTFNLAIDHGNRLIKTVGSSFNAGLIEVGYLPSMGADVLNYKGKSYALSSKSQPVMVDKSLDERYFILSLFAIAKEAKAIGLAEGEVNNVELLVGLPLQHYQVYKKKLEAYFLERETIRFSMNSDEYIINITKARVYPQAYAAAITAFDRLKDSKVVNIIDIGGYTVDCLQLTDFKPNMNLCTSLYTGVRTLFDDINDIIRSTGAKDLDDSIIEGVLTKDAYYLAEYSPKKIAIIEDAAQKHVDKMLAEIIQKGFDLEEQKAVFMGGGSLLLKDYILKSKKAQKAVFIDDVYANAKGYKMLYEMEAKQPTSVRKPNVGEANA